MSILGEESVSQCTCIQEDLDDQDAELPIKKVISSENFERSATAKVSQVLLILKEILNVTVTLVSNIMESYGN